MRYEIRSWFIYMIILLILIGIASLIVVITSQEKMNPSPLAAKGVQPSASDTLAEDADRQLIHQFIFPETVSMLVNPPRDEISDLFLNPSARDNDPERLFALLLFRNFEPYPSPDEVKFSFLPSPDDQLNPKYKEAAFKKNLNIEILLDASGSMKENISTEGGPTKWETAVKEIESFVG
ncbi:MAG: hypothetical protein IMW85_06430, partial [Thermicanus sp.]|nr:hypothetical protein [Thermicanus sp.]